MSLMRFLLDEHVPLSLVPYLHTKESHLDVVQVGGPGAPPKGTPDPDLLLIAEAEGRAVICQDYSTMPQHAADHVAAGRHTWGVFLIRPRSSLIDCGDAIILLWAASSAEEWRDHIKWIPF